MYLSSIYLQMYLKFMMTLFILSQISFFVEYIMVAGIFNR